MDADLMRLIENLTLAGVLLYAWLTERRERQEMTRAIIELARLRVVVPPNAADVMTVTDAGNIR